MVAPATTREPVACRAAAGKAINRPRALRQPTTERACTECNLTKPIEAFLPIASTRTDVYGCCRQCRNKRARERYHSTAETRTAEIARSLKNKRARQLRASATDRWEPWQPSKVVTPPLRDVFRNSEVEGGGRLA